MKESKNIYKFVYFNAFFLERHRRLWKTQFSRCYVTSRHIFTKVIHIHKYFIARALRTPFFDVTRNFYLWSVRLSLHMATHRHASRHNRSSKRRRKLSSEEACLIPSWSLEPARFWPVEWPVGPRGPGSSTLEKRWRTEGGFGVLSLIVVNWRSIVFPLAAWIFGKCRRPSPFPAQQSPQFVCQPARDRPRY